MKLISILCLTFSAALPAWSQLDVWVSHTVQVPEPANCGSANNPCSNLNSGVSSVFTGGTIHALDGISELEVSSIARNMVIDGHGVLALTASNGQGIPAFTIYNATVVLRNLTINIAQGCIACDGI